MTELQIGDQTIRYDREATAAIYATIQHGDAEECGCPECQNFARQRSSAYPETFLALLEQLGIDPQKEGEVFYGCPVDDGCHMYGGWFFLVGELIEAGETNTMMADSHTFRFFFTSVCPNALAFRNGPLLAIEFMTHVRLVLPNPPKSTGPASAG